MAKDSFKVKKSLNIKPTDPSTLTNREAGDIIVDSTDNNKLKTYNPSSDTYQSVSTPGGLDTVFVENLESNTSSSFTTGQNATPDAAGTGTLGGAVSDETSSQISGERSLKYTMNATAASSNNDFFLNDTDIVLDAKHKGNFIGISFYYTYDGADNDIRFFVLDQDDNEVTTSSEFIKTASVATRFNTLVTFPSSATAFRYGFQVVTGNSSKVFIVDDIEFSTNPFIYKNLQDQQYIAYSSFAGNGSSANRIPYFTTAEQNIGSNILTVENSSTNGFSVTANQDCTVTFSYSDSVEGSNYKDMGISLNASSLTTNIESLSFSEIVALTNTTNVDSITDSVCARVKLNAGDVLRPHHDGNSSDSSSNRAFVRIHAEAEAEHVVTPAKVVNEYYKTTSMEVVNFWDATGATDNFDTSLIPLTDSQLLEWNDTTETRLVAKKDVVIDVSIYGVVNAGQNISIRDSSGNSIGYVREATFGYLVSVPLEIKLTAGDYIYFLHSSATSRTGGISISARAAEAQFLAAVPMDYTQTKILSTTLLNSTTDIADLRFENLTIGKTYRVVGQAYLRTDDTNGHNSNFQVLHDGNVVGRAFLQHPSAGGTLNTVYGLNTKTFTATTTTVTVNWTESGSTALIGNGTLSDTWLEIQELNYTKETTRFS